jgi:hypothetical protein
MMAAAVLVMSLAFESSDDLNIFFESFLLFCALTAMCHYRSESVGLCSLKAL